jgi:hypothetical protein
MHQSGAQGEKPLAQPGGGLMSLSEADRTTLGCRKLRLCGYTIIFDRKRAVVVLSRFSCVDVW